MDERGNHGTMADQRYSTFLKANYPKGGSNQFPGKKSFMLVDDGGQTRNMGAPRDPLKKWTVVPLLGSYGCLILGREGGAGPPTETPSGH